MLDQVHSDAFVGVEAGVALVMSLERVMAFAAIATHRNR